MQAVLRRLGANYSRALTLVSLSLSPSCEAIRGKGCCVGCGAMNAAKTAAAMAAILVARVDDLRSGARKSAACSQQGLLPKWIY